MTVVGRWMIAASATAYLAALTVPAPARAQASSLLESFGEIMVFNHLYSGSDGKSHIEEMAVPPAMNGNMTTYFDRPVQKFTIAYWKDGDVRDFHYAGHKNLLIYMQGTLTVTTGDDKIYVLKPGQVTLAEDWTGKGHTFRCVAPDKKRVCMFLQITVAELERTLPLQPPPK